MGPWACLSPGVCTCVVCQRVQTHATEQGKLCAATLLSPGLCRNAHGNVHMGTWGKVGGRGAQGPGALGCRHSPVPALVSPSGQWRHDVCPPRWKCGGPGVTADARSTGMSIVTPLVTWLQFLLPGPSTVFVTRQVRPY